MCVEEFLTFFIPGINSVNRVGATGTGWFYNVHGVVSAWAAIHNDFSRYPAKTIASARNTIVTPLDGPAGCSQNLAKC